MKMTPFLEYVVYDIFTDSRQVTFRPMMGGYALYYEGSMFAFIDGDDLYIKGRKEESIWYTTQGSKQFSYRRQGKEVYLCYFLVPPAIYEDREVFGKWLDKTLSYVSSLRNM
jgi:DNA transformation protein and related proteins